MGWIPEDLTSQIDGAETYFDTTFARVLERMVLFHDGAQVTSALYEEPDASRVRTLFTPQVGETLFIVYWTDQTIDGRVVGYTDDPSGMGPLPPSLEDLLESFDQRLDALEAIGVTGGRAELDKFTALVDQTVFTLGRAPIVDQPIVLFVGGNAYTREGGFITVGGIDNKTVTWIHTGFSMLAGDRVEVLYWTAES